MFILLGRTDAARRTAGHHSQLDMIYNDARTDGQVAILACKRMLAKSLYLRDAQTNDCDSKRTVACALPRMLGT